ncbi:MAG TPA: thiamine pyrophosphate-binding protein [Candidatus Methylomirabilis sp.]|nr:thiamine pyrophosphate-binding protein [Candidatus Methylomirabilis sp.]
MAATEGELSDKPGVCLVALGPGAASTVNGMAHAFLDQAPLLLLTDRSPRVSLYLAARQHLDHFRLFQGVAKDAATITAPRAESVLRWAWRKALAVPKGPVHLDFPADEATRPTRRHGLRPETTRMPGPSRSAIRTAGRLLVRRGRTVVIAGLGCSGTKSARAFQDLAEHLGAPVLTTQKAKGVIPEDHPLAAGVFSGGRLEQDLLARADGILVVGVDSVELLPRAWGSGQPVVSLAEYRIGPRPFDTAAEIIADLSESLDALRESLPPGGGWGLAEWAGQAAAFKARSRRLLAEACAGRGREGLSPHRVVEIAREIFPRETVVTVDTGAHMYVAAAFWDTFRPKEYLCSGGLATMGYALPAATTAKLLNPQRPILALVGDGGFLVSLPDIVTAVRLGLPLVVIVFKDGSFSLVRARQEQRRYAPIGVSMEEVDVPMLAESLGALGTEVEDEEGLRSAVKDALVTTQPAIIAARVRPNGYRRMLEMLYGKGLP